MSRLSKILILVLTIGGCGALTFWYQSSKHKQDGYQIIYLNGGSSSGKSTLARALQAKLQKPFLVIGIDQMIFMMPEKLNDWHNGSMAPGFSWQPVKDEERTIIASEIHVGSFGKHIIRTLKDVVVTLAQSGHHVMIDDVSFGKEQVDAWRAILKPFKVLWLGVSAPLDVIDSREKERGDRKLGTARWQAEKVHVGVDYDRMINTHEQSPDENVAIISKYIEGLK